MSKLLSFFVVAGIALCGCSSNPKPEDASKKGDDSPPSDTTEGETAVNTGQEKDTVERPSGGIKATGVERNEDQGIPDDYSLTERDCVDLGKKKSELALADFRAQVGPKVTEKQRAAAEPQFQAAAEKDGDKFAEGCLKGLVGKVVDHSSLKCAFAAKDVKGFDSCLNGPPDPKPPR